MGKKQRWAPSVPILPIHTCCSTPRVESISTLGGTSTLPWYLNCGIGTCFPMECQGYDILGVLSPSSKRNGTFIIHPFGETSCHLRNLTILRPPPCCEQSPRQPCGEPAKAPNVSKGFVTQLTQTLLNKLSERFSQGQKTTSRLVSSDLFKLLV